MSCPKRNSSILNKAEERFISLQAIDAQLDLNNNLTLSTFEEDMAVLRQLFHEYNAMLANLDALFTELRRAEKTVKDRSEQMLLGVAAKFGKDSLEYKKAGGTPKSERKRPARPAPMGGMV